MDNEGGTIDKILGQGWRESGEYKVEQYQADEDGEGLVGVPPQPLNLERIPLFMTPAGFSDKFYEFFKIIVDAVQQPVPGERLWEISGAPVSKVEFIQMVHRKWSAHLEIFNNTPEALRGLDVQINQERFSADHRCIVGGIFIHTYHVKVDEDPVNQTNKSANIKLATTEVLFTYKDKKFVLIPVFKSFAYEDEQKQ